MYRTLHFFLFFISIVFYLTCGKKLEDGTVAKINQEKITFDEFYLSFNLYPHFRKNLTLRQARLQQLDFLVDRIYLKMAAEAEGIDKDRDIAEKLNYIKQKEMLKKLYEINVLDKIKISKEDAWEEYKRSNIQIEMRHLFAKTLDQAQKYYYRLQNGFDFYQLAKLSFKDSTLANNGGYLGYLTFTDLDPMLIDSVYNLKIGKYSKPLRSSYGYHIILIENVKQSIFLSREYFQQHKDIYVASLKKRRAAHKSAEFVSMTLKNKSVDINPPIFQRLIDVSKKNILERRQEYPFAIPAVTDRELQKITNTMDLIADSILVKFTGGHWTVSDFLERLKKMPPMDRPIVNRKRVLINKIVNMVRDELLLQEAYKEKIDEDHDFKKEMTKWRSVLLAEEFRKRIYWVKYKEKDEAKWNYRKNLYRFIKTKYPVKIDTTILFKDVNKEQLNERMPLINITVREPYIW